jgi:hypothetical protein
MKYLSLILICLSSCGGLIVEGIDANFPDEDDASLLAVDAEDVSLPLFIPIDAATHSPDADAKPE